MFSSQTEWRSHWPCSLWLHLECTSRAVTHSLLRLGCCSQHWAPCRCHAPRSVSLNATRSGQYMYSRLSTAPLQPSHFMPNSYAGC